MKIILMMAITVNGKIGEIKRPFPDSTSKEDKKMFAAVSKEHGVVIMGDKTFFTFPKPLPGSAQCCSRLEKNSTENLET